MFSEFYQYLKVLAQKGGPDPVDYENLNNFFSVFMTKIKQGKSPENDLDNFYSKIPALLCDTSMHGFTILKPHGYAGDFELIERIYQYWISPKEELKKWDHFSQNQKACIAVRNRKDFFIDLVCNLYSQFVEQSRAEPFCILNVGSGPGRDVFELLSIHDLPVSIDCVDQDKTAINYAKNLCHSFDEQVTFFNSNIFYFRGRKKYDLIWSAGLFDYLDDRLFKLLLRKLYKQLKLNGRLVVGNFSPNNPSRDYMEFGQWYLNHRYEEELFLLADGLQGKVSIEKEQEGINLFLTIKK